MSITASRKYLSGLIQGSALLLLILVAAYVSIGRILIANVSQYQSEIENALSNGLGVSVEFDALEGSWSYLNPGLSFRNLRIGAEGELVIGAINIELDAVASLREATLVVSSLGLKDVKLSVEYIDSRWHVKGMPVGNKPANIKPLVTSLDYLNDFSLEGLHIDVATKSRHYTITSQLAERCELVKSDSARTFSLPLLLQYDDEPGRKPESFLFAGRYQGEFDTIDFHSQVYLSLPDIDIAEFLPTQQAEKYSVQQAFVGGDFWLTYEGKSLKVFGKPNLSASLNGGQHKLFAGLSFAAAGRLDSQLLISIPKMTASIDQVNWQANDTDLSLLFTENATEFSASLASLKLNELASTFSELGDIGVILNPEQAELLRALKPKGSLQKLYLVGAISPGGNSFKLTSELSSVSIEKYKALPYMSSLNGFVSLSPDAGFLDISNDQPFELQFPSLFEMPWPFDTARARIHYERKNGELTVNSGLVEMTRGDLIATGQLELNLPGDPLLTTWGLELGVRNAELLDSNRYLPNTLKDDLRGWLNRAILGGFAKESGMVFHGSLARDAEKDQKAHQLYFKVDDAVLDYDPHWPRFDDLSATIFIDNDEISSNDASGQIYDSQVVKSSVLVPVSPEGIVDTILIDGEVSGPFSDGLRVLTETPLFDATNQMADGWSSARGDMSGRVKLNIPLGMRVEKGEPTLADVTIETRGVTVDMPQFNLQLTQLAGDFRYESNSALSSSDFTAELFDHPISGHIDSVGNIEGGEIGIYVSGDAEMQAIQAWSDQILLTRTSGLMHYNSDLHIFYGSQIQQPIYVRTTSQLAGVTINLPEPMGKTASTRMPLEYKQTFIDSGYRVELSLGDKVKASLKLVDGILAGGRLNFGDGPLGAVAFDRLEVTGSLDKVRYEEWERFSEELDSKSDVSFEDQLALTLDAIKLNIGQLDVYGLDLDKVDTRITRDKNAWNVGLSNQMLEGIVRVLDDNKAPLEINLDRLTFESEASTSQSGENKPVDPLGDVDPGNLLAANIDLKQLEVDGEDYGSWKFNYQPNGKGAVLTNLFATVKGLEIVDGAEVDWNKVDGEMQSRFVGSLVVPNLAEALKQWGYASSIEGTNFNFWSDVSWQGSPAMVDIENISGSVKLIKGKGRFVQAESNMGALRLLGIFDFASLMKRFRFDFSDVVKSGFSFDKISGVSRFHQGVIDVVEPINIEGSGSTFKLGGRINLKTRALDNDMIVTLPVNRNLPWYAAYAAIVTGPLTGAGVFLAQKVFQNQINAISSAKYKITGTIDDPVIEFDSIFSDSVRKAPDSDETNETQTKAGSQPQPAIPSTSP